MNDGVLVSKRWLERANVKLFGNKEIDEEGKATGSVFYDVRPARLQSAWTQSNGVWTATACFVVNDAVDTSFTFPVYAPTATEDPGGTAETTRFFVVWRGRWELVAGAAKIPTVTKVTKSSFVKTITTSSGSFLTSATTSNTTETKQVLTGVLVTSGALIFSSEQITYVKTVITSTNDSTAVTAVDKTTANAVTSVTVN